MVDTEVRGLKPVRFFFIEVMQYQKFIRHFLKGFTLWVVFLSLHTNSKEITYLSLDVQFGLVIMILKGLTETYSHFRVSTHEFRHLTVQY